MIHEVINQIEGTGPTQKLAPGPERTKAIEFLNACGDGKIDRVRALHESGADLNYLSQAGTPLHWAAGKGNTDVILYLINHGAAIDPLNANGLTPAFMAAAVGCDEGVIALVNAGTSLKTVAQGNVTLLHMCAENNLKGAVRAILKTQEGLEAAKTFTNENNLPIHYAAMAKHIDMIETLKPFSGEPWASMTNEQFHVIGEERLAIWFKNNIVPEDAKKNTQSPQQIELPKPPSQLQSPSIAPTLVRDEVLEREVDAIKSEGNRFFVEKNFEEAIIKYSEAISKSQSNYQLYGNRSAAYLALGQNTLALQDAEVCRQLKPDFAKGCYRLASARLALNMFEDAALAAFEGLKLEPNNETIKTLLRKCVDEGRKHHQEQQNKTTSS